MTFPGRGGGGAGGRVFKELSKVVAVPDVRRESLHKRLYEVGDIV